MSLSDELAWKSAAEIALLIRRKALSPVEVLDATIERIEARNPSLNALVYFAYDEARAAAKAAEEALTKGEPLGLLHGVPSALKDLFDFKPGWISTLGGLPRMANHKVDATSGFAEGLERAGAVLVGMTNSPVLGFRGCCDNPLFGPTRNPFDLSRNSGGSSGGAAAAVGDGLLSVVQGTDGGGSIRIPSAFCGVYGFKPSPGRIPRVARPNAFSGVTPFLFEGPIARTVEDAALLMTALHDYNPRDPFSLDQPMDYMGALGRSVKGWKIAYTPAWDGFPIEKPVADAVAAGVRAFEEAGAHVDEVKLGIDRPQGELSALWCRMITPLGLSTFEYIKELGLDLLGDHRDEFPPEYLEWADACQSMTATEFYRDQEIRTEVYDAIQDTLDDYDIIVGPTLCCLPVKNTARGTTKGPTEINGEAINPLIGWCPTYLINYTGNPAASIPCGPSPEGLPVGLQIVGRRFRDDDVLTASAAFERLRPWMGTYAAAENRPMSVPDAA